MSALVNCLCSRCRGTKPPQKLSEYLAHLEPRVTTLADGSQFLLDYHDDGRVTVVTRPNRDADWGDPVELEEEL